MIYLYSIQTLDEIPAGTEYRVLADRLGTGAPTFIQTKAPVDLPVQENDYGNGVAIWDEGCIQHWEVKQAPVLPDIKETVTNMKINAANRTLETSAELKAQASEQELVGLVNATPGYKIGVVE